MKKTLITLFAWTAIMLVFTFFFAGRLIQSIYALAIAAAVVLTALTRILESQSARIDALEERIRELEEK